MNLSSKFQKSVRSLIITLLNVHRPTTVTRFVISVVVDALDRMFFRRFATHIFEKIWKRIDPFLTHFNSTPAISSEEFGFGIGASFFHSRPCSIFRRCTARWSMAMLSEFVNHPFFSIATAATSISILESERRKNNDFSAVAFTFPVNTFASSFNYRNSSQATEFLSRDVYK